MGGLLIWKQPSSPRPVRDVPMEDPPETESRGAPGPTVNRGGRGPTGPEDGNTRDSRPEFTGMDRQSLTSPPVGTQRRTVSADSVGPFTRKGSPRGHQGPMGRPAGFAGKASSLAFPDRKLPGGRSEVYPHAPAVNMIRGRSASVQAPRQRSASPAQGRLPGMPPAPSDPRRSLGAQRPGYWRIPSFRAPWTPLGTLAAGIHPQTHIRPSVAPP